MSIRHRFIASGAALALFAFPVPHAVAAQGSDVDHHDFDQQQQSLSLKLYRDNLAFETTKTPAPRGAEGRAADGSTIDRDSGDAAFTRWLELLQQQMRVQNALDR